MTPRQAASSAFEQTGHARTLVDVRMIALMGNPNTGKTTLFNALTGGWARTGNYPGVTVDKVIGTLRDDGHESDAAAVSVLDLPGTYSLSARSPDEMVAVDILLGRRADTPRPAAVVVVVDATNLERNLYLVTQVVELGLPMVVALNMGDTARRRGIDVDTDALSKELGLPVVSTVGHRGEGVAELRAAVLQALDGDPPPEAWEWPPAVRAAEALLGESLKALGLTELHAVERRRALLDVDGEAEHRLVARGGQPALDALADAREVIGAEGASAAGLEASVRYGFIGGVVKACIRRAPETPPTVSDRIDRVLTHRVFGTLALLAVMTTVFLSIFAWAAPLVDFIDGTVFGGLSKMAEGWTWLGDGALKSLVVDGLIAGVGSVLVFLPQILILFGFISILEGCGYMSRAAFLADGLLRRCGLSGRSFIPMLSSFACAVPGIMGARTIENRRDRLVTILVAPFMSCAARIPVYVLLIAAFVPPKMLLGFVPLQGVVFASMYFVGIAVAIGTAFLLKKTIYRGERPSFLVELPPYRVPAVGVVLRRVYESGMAFVTRAGTLIFAATVLIWALSYFPRHPDPGTQARAEAEQERATFEVEGARLQQAVLEAEDQGPLATERARAGYQGFLARVEERNAQLDVRIQDAASAESLEYSALGRAGKWVQPVFEPMGWDWKVSVGVLASFPAREVFVSSLGVIYQVGSDVDGESEGLRERLRSATWDDGPRRGLPVLDLAGAIALMVFFALCAQCVSTLVTIRKETGRWGWAAFSFAYMTTLAWLGALVVTLVFRGGLGS